MAAMAGGLIERRRSVEDERRVQVSLTETGRALRDRAGDIIRCVAAATGIAPDGLRRLNREIRTLRTAIERATAHDTR